MLNIAKSTIHAAGIAYLRKVLESERDQNKASPRGPNECTHEYAFALNSLRLAPLHQDVLDVGSGSNPLPALIKTCGYKVTAVDNIKDYWSDRRSSVNRHWLIEDLDITKGILNSKFGIITCISVIEHISNHLAAITNMARMLKPEGVIIVTHPYNEKIFVDNIYQHPDAGFGQNEKYKCSIYNREILESWQQAAGLRIIEQRYFAIYNGPFWTMGGRLRPTREVSVTDLHQLTATVFTAA